MGVVEAIIIGVVSGILTSFLLWAIYSVFYLNIFLPKLESILYQGVTLDGKWSNKKLDDKTIYDVVLDIQQKGYNISGTFVATGRIDKNDNSFYSIEGRISQGYLILEYHAISRQKLGMGTILTRVGEGGDALIGSILFVDEKNMNTATIKDIKLVRI